LRSAGAEAHANGGDGGIFADDFGEGPLAAHRVGKRDVLRRIGRAEDETGILLREEALGMMTKR
jgi:hypothetical protein